MHSVRHMASPSSRVRSEPAFGFGTEEQRPRPGQRNAWKMEQPREGVSGRSHTPDRSSTPLVEPAPRTAGQRLPQPPTVHRRLAGRRSRSRLARSTARASLETSTALPSGPPRAARHSTSWEARATTAGSRSTRTSRQARAYVHAHCKVGSLPAGHLTIHLPGSNWPQVAPTPALTGAASPGLRPPKPPPVHHLLATPQRSSSSTLARSSRGRRGRPATCARWRRVCRTRSAP